jgi:sugar phosphate isomerase/epimerase
MDVREVDFCLEPLTVLDCGAEEGVEIAAAAGCRYASQWVQPPGFDLPMRCLVEDRATADRVRASLAANGVRPLNIEVFQLTPETEVASFRRPLEIGASLGAAAATVIFTGTPEAGQRVDQFVEFCRLAAEFGLRANVEFSLRLSPYTLVETEKLIRRAAQPNAGIVVDILHLMRSGGSIDQLGRTAPELVGHAQLCDGPATISPEAQPLEGLYNRMPPGEGTFPIRAFCEALPHVPLGLEVPPTSDAVRGLTPEERVLRIANSARRALGAGEAVS